MLCRCSLATNTVVTLSQDGSGWIFKVLYVYALLFTEQSPNKSKIWTRIFNLSVQVENLYFAIIHYEVIKAIAI